LTLLRSGYFIHVLRKLCTYDFIGDVRCRGAISIFLRLGPLLFWWILNTGLFVRVLGGDVVEIEKMWLSVKTPPLYYIVLLFFFWGGEIIERDRPDIHVAL